MTIFKINMSVQSWSAVNLMSKPASCIRIPAWPNLDQGLSFGKLILSSAVDIYDFSALPFGTAFTLTTYSEISKFY